MNKKNEDIKKEIKESGLKFWQVAYAIGISDTTFSRKLRIELKIEEKQKIRAAIKLLLEEKQREFNL